MNYDKIYDQLINRARGRILTGHTEKHHIVPVSMGGTNHKSNLVKLTGREHLIAHLLLWKIHKNCSMSAAIWFMAHSRGIRINSRVYETLRADHAEHARISNTGRNVSDITRDKMSKSFTGRVFTDEHKESIGNSSRGRPSGMKGKSFNLTEEQKKLRSDNRKGKGMDNNGWPGERTAEYKQKISEAKIGHAAYNFRRVSANGIEYNSAADAARVIGVTYNWLMRRIKLDKYADYFYIS